MEEFEMYHVINLLPKLRLYIIYIIYITLVLNSVYSLLTAIQCGRKPVDCTSVRLGSSVFGSALVLLSSEASSSFPLLLRRDIVTKSLRAARII